MPDLTPETRVAWREDVQRANDRDMGHPWLWHAVHLLDALDEAERERDEYERRWQEDAVPSFHYAERYRRERDEAREALARVEALAETTLDGECNGVTVPLPLIWASDLRAALRGPSDTEGQA